MPATSLAERVRMNRKSRSPVQDTVSELFDDITESLAQGGSFRTIYAQLTVEGHNVGKRHTSLFAAYKVVKRLHDQQLAGSPHTTGTAPQHVSLGATAESSDSNSFGQMPTAVSDTRRKIDEW